MRLEHWRSILAGAALLALALMASWLLIAPSGASADGGAGPGTTVSYSNQRPPTHTPTHGPTPTSTATSSPTATATSSPTATATRAPTPTPTRTGGSGSPPTATTAPHPAAPSATATPTEFPTATAAVNVAAGGSGSAGSGDEPAPASDTPPGLLVWGLGALVLLIFGGLIALFVRLAPPQEQRTLDVLTRTSAQMRPNLPARQARRGRRAAPPMPAGGAAEPPKEGQLWKLPPPQEPRPQAPLKPPRWLIDAGLLKGDTGEQPAKDSQEP